MNTLLRRLTPAVLLLAATVTPASSQLVSIRTAPVAVSEQFWVYPSELKGMGGGLALKDLELDPFGNPAAAARIDGWRLTGSPSLYSIPDDDGFGRSLPVSVLGGGERTFGGASIAVQELESAFRRTWWGPWFTPQPTDGRSGERFATNVYTTGMIGRRWPAHGLAVAVSGSYAKLDKVHAVDLLYPQSIGIEQGGHISDLRIGVVKELEEDSYLEGVIVRNKVDMGHTVTYRDFVLLDPETTEWGWSDPRREVNLDRTTTWGAHAKYAAGTSPGHWRWAAALTANVKSHPKIPNYEFMGIPRDPGDSYAFRIALGAARETSSSRLALDFAYEPIWTSTWAEAAEDITTERGTLIRKGDMTVENEFVFSNYALHVGYAHQWDEFGVQLGLAGRSIRYFLDQYNAITDVQREQDENWYEITPTWGVTFAFDSFELRYFGQHRGGGLDFDRFGPVVATPDLASDGPDIVAAPSGPLSMEVTSVTSHEIGVSVPFGMR